MKLLIAISIVLTLCAGVVPAQSLYNDVYVLNSCCESTTFSYGKIKIGPKQYKFSTRDSFELNLNTSGFQITYLSDEKGDFQFVYDGLLIHDSKGEVIENPFPDLNKNGKQWRCGMVGETSTCSGEDYVSSIVLTGPTERYMIFRMNWEYTPSLNHRFKGQDILCSIIEKNPQTHKYKVVEYFSIPLVVVFTEGMSIVRHADGQSWWLIIPSFRTGHFVSVHISSEGKILNQIVSQPEYPYPTKGYEDLNLHPITDVSPDGNKLALMDIYRRNIVLYNIDRCSGILYNPRKVHFDEKAESWNIYLPWYLGMCFSPNSRFLYFGEYYSERQYDTEAEDIEASEVILGERLYYDVGYDTITYKVPPHLLKQSQINFATQQLGSNGKIYIRSVQEGNTIWNAIIENPDEKGAAAGLKPFGFYNYAQAIIGPNTPNFDLGPLPAEYCAESRTDIDFDIKVLDGSVNISVNNIPEGISEMCLKVFDMMGRVMYQSCEAIEPYLVYEKQYQLNGEILSNACYVASIQFDNGIYRSQKFIVIR